MINKREFINKITGDRQGCYAGSALEDALVRDPDWEPAKGDKASEGDGEPEKGSRKPGVPEELGSLTRAQLNDIAIRVGVENPDGLPNKDEVIDAIHKHADSLDEAKHEAAKTEKRELTGDKASEGDGS